MLNSVGACKKIVINDDGEETELEFNDKGELKKIYDDDLTEFYKSGQFSAQYVEDGAIVKLTREIIGWSMSIKDTDGFGFENIFYTDNNGKGYRITGMKSVGTDDQGDATLTTEDYTYNSDGDCTKKDGVIMVDNQKVGSYTSFITYTNKNSPFANNPFQWLIETNWSGGGHTNRHLTDSENQVYTKVDDEFDARLETDIRYNYSFDNKGRLNGIRINKQERRIIKKISTGQTTTDKEESTKIITFSYEC